MPLQAKCRGRIIVRENIRSIRKDVLAKCYGLYWNRGKDVLILSLYADQYDQPQFEIMICHVGNIENLLAAEKEESSQYKPEKTEAGRKLF